MPIISPECAADQGEEIVRKGTIQLLRTTNMDITNGEIRIPCITCDAVCLVKLKVEKGKYSAIKSELKEAACLRRSEN